MAGDSKTATTTAAGAGGSHMFAPPALTSATASNLEQLKTVVGTTLESRGALPQLRAALRAHVFHALASDDADSDSAAAGASQPPPLSNANLILNELIREYLQFNAHNHTLSVFQAESGQPRDIAFDRAFLTHHLHIPQPNAAAQQIPLLYSILATMQHSTPASNSAAAAAAHPSKSSAADSAKR